MQKFQEFLIKNCQWFAIGGGVLFVLLVIWKFVLAPVEVKLDATHSASALSVDDEVAKRAAELERAMEGKGVTLTSDKISPETEFKLIAAGPKPPAMISPAKWPSNGAPEIVEPTKIAAVEKQFVKELPAVPLATPSELRAGLASATIIAAPQGAMPGAAPVMPAAGAPGAPAPVDKAWVKFSYDISPAEIARSFTKANVPAFTFQTAIVGVELWRQELLPDGKYSDPVQIKRLQNSPQFPAVPAANAQWNVIQPFMVTVESGTFTTDLMHPAFYTVSAGEDPMLAKPVPSVTPTVEPVVPQAPPQRQNPRGNNRREMMPDMPGGPGGPGGGGRAPRGGRGGNTGLTPSNSSPRTINAGMQLAQALPPNIFTPGVPPPMSDGGYPEGGGVGPGGMMPGGQMPGQPLQPGQLPAGLFNPSQPGVAGNFQGWLFDETALPSHTYRYKVRYALRNPVFGAQNVCDPAQPLLNQTYAIWSEPDPVAINSEGWSNDITVPPMSKFFVKPWGGGSPNSISIEVFRWTKGIWKPETFTVAMGDLVGKSLSNLDFGTGYTLVDARTDDRGSNNRRVVAILLAPDGSLVMRDPATDQKSPERAELVVPANPITPNGPTGFPGGIDGPGWDGTGNPRPPMPGRGGP